MYIDIVPNRSSPPAILLRESLRQGQKIVKRTLANLSALSLSQAEAIRAVLKGQPLAAVDKVFEIIHAYSTQTGHPFQRKLDSRSEATHGVDAVYAVVGSIVNFGWSFRRDSPARLRENPPQLGQHQTAAITAGTTA